MSKSMEAVWQAEIKKHEAVWQAEIKKHNALEVKAKDMGNWPRDRAVAFETSNFGWILSAKDAEGKRKILLQL